MPRLQNILVELYADSNPRVGLNQHGDKFEYVNDLSVEEVIHTNPVVTQIAQEDQMDEPYVTPSVLEVIASGPAMLIKEVIDTAFTYSIIPLINDFTTSVGSITLDIARISDALFGSTTEIMEKLLEQIGSGLKSVFTTPTLLNDFFLALIAINDPENIRVERQEDV